MIRRDEQALRTREGGIGSRSVEQMAKQALAPSRQTFRSVLLGFGRLQPRTMMIILLPLLLLQGVIWTSAAATVLAVGFIGEGERVLRSRAASS